MPTRRGVRTADLKIPYFGRYDDVSTNLQEKKTHNNKTRDNFIHIQIVFMRRSTRVIEAAGRYLNYNIGFQCNRRRWWLYRYIYS